MINKISELSQPDTHLTHNEPDGSESIFRGRTEGLQRKRKERENVDLGNTRPRLSRDMYCWRNKIEEEEKIFTRGKRWKAEISLH